MLLFGTRTSSDQHCGRLQIRRAYFCLDSGDRSGVPRRCDWYVRRVTGIVRSLVDAQQYPTKKYVRVLSMPKILQQFVRRYVHKYTNRVLFEHMLSKAHDE